MSCESQQRSAMRARCIAYGAPIASAIVTISAFYVLRHYERGGLMTPAMYLMVSFGFVVFFFGGAAIASFGAAAGGALLPDHRTGVRVGGAVMYGVAGLLAYALMMLVMFRMQG